MSIKYRAHRNALSAETLFAILIVAIIITFSESFKVYWNVPSEVCQIYGIYFNLSAYNIIQNSHDKFHGEKISIIYYPGKFPSYKDATPVYGGIPQKADIIDHIATFEKQVSETIPKNFNGYMVLDFESYQPYYDLASGIYRNASRAWVSEKNPRWPDWVVDYVSKKTFNHEAEFLFLILLEVGKKLRPQAKWGYYHYPYCDNTFSDDLSHCKIQQIDGNVAMRNVFKESGALYPSIYVFKNGWSSSTRGQQMRHRLLNAIQIKEQTPSSADILSYFWFKYHDVYDEYIDPVDLWSTLGISWHLKLDGSIIWGDNKSVATEIGCLQLKNYVQQYLGPVVKILTEIPADEFTGIKDFGNVNLQRPTYENDQKNQVPEFWNSLIP